ncbi:hypothetical protein HPP92_024370 [Vanilla planifolia]|uniref:Uncharacterized protein n=1 Tax=Vanilla planifolia TaxID=51239 RepID=A0A835PV07_VANPL|nr:hypothetical protein HPP92_024370 [Vanilla planifolia]
MRSRMSCIGITVPFFKICYRRIYPARRVLLLVRICYNGDRISQRRRRRRRVEVLFEVDGAGFGVDLEKADFVIEESLAVTLSRRSCRNLLNRECFRCGPSRRGEEAIVEVGLKCWIR